MNASTSPFRLAAVFLLTSALLHILAFMVGGFTSAALILIPAGIAYVLIAAGLNRGMRRVAWLAFFVTGIGGSVALALAYGTGPIPAWWYAAIAAADWAATLALLAALWRPATTSPSA